MKKISKIFAGAVVLALFFAANAYAIEVTVENERVVFDGQPPVNIDGRTLVPIRGVFEKLGFEVRWHPETGRVTLVGETLIELTVGSHVFTADGAPLFLDVPVRIINDRAMIPARAVAESAGFYVAWNQQTQTVIIGAQPSWHEMDFRAADNFRGFTAEYVFLERGILAMAARDGVIFARQADSRLVASENSGANWHFVHAFDREIQGIHLDDSGNIFVSVSHDRWSVVPTGALFKSDDGGENFRQVLEIQAGAAMNWSIASGGGLMFVSEYGYKGDSGNNARRVYRSEDFGETWEIVFKPEPLYDWHNHKTLIVGGGVIYQSIGDGEHARIKRSDDNGDTWRVVVYGYHPTSAVVFDTHILWGLDAGRVPGVIRYDRHTGEVTQSLALPPPFNGPAYDMIFVNGVVVTAFMSYGGQDFPASIFISRDEGATWQLVGYIEKPEPARGIGLYHIVACERFIYFDIGTRVIRGGVEEPFRGTLRIKVE